MGACLSIGVKAQTPIHLGIQSMDENESSDITQTPRTKGEVLKSSNLKSFCFEDLKAATKNFSLDSMVGEGRFGFVYKGWIDEKSFAVAKPGEARMAIALKRLDGDVMQGQKEWLAEIDDIGRLDHPSLVKLIGYCVKDEYRLLAYEFMAYGSLENHLFKRNTYFPPLSWNNRMKIALDVSHGLAFLHSDEVKLIYGNLKTSNILLDSKYNAKLSDLGLPLDGPKAELSPLCARIISTHVYTAPEYVKKGLLTNKSDVYSFGVVFLEILTGRRAHDIQRPVREQNLVSWAVPLMNKKRKLLTIIDPRIQGQYSINKVQKAASLAVKCLSVNPNLRPNMPQVVEVLEQLQDGSSE
ncbi:unnamed protein product [Rhodiola kirilowii]